MRDLDNMQIGNALPIATNMVLSRPFAPYQLDLVEQSFKTVQSGSHWRGYAILNTIPELLRTTIMSPLSEDQLGVILFSSDSNQHHFIFRDIHDHFRLINDSGHTVFMDEQLETVIQTFISRFHQ